VDLILIAKSFWSKLNFKLAVFNLFDEKAYEPSPYDPNAVDSSQIPSGAWIAGDYPLTGRGYYAGIDYTF
jgi:outer membrane receptor protein involved in Fe transport